MLLKNQWLSKCDCDAKSGAISVERLEKLPFSMNIIKVAPVRYDYLDSSLKDCDYSSRQHIDFD